MSADVGEVKQQVKKFLKVFLEVLNARVYFARVGATQAVTTTWGDGLPRCLNPGLCSLLEDIGGIAYRYPFEVVDSIMTMTEVVIASYIDELPPGDEGMYISAISKQHGRRMSNISDIIAWERWAYGVLMEVEERILADIDVFAQEIVEYIETDI